ncbi:hypothetical protein GCM10011391_24150 [Pullulanibacillus camelliae]|uniref:LiaF transmembrane domain-containing protein n=1 Tax=Pullulanibacillus camelliae TaxID=1707096 RepID=A0A8J2YI55_9BACL|nr:hypothetical protein [Pullulanibacillus camelliae]GGE44530.1 hypothetical protein GCM10011391_24150 [Pullulanibacillus camelliae]
MKKRRSLTFSIPNLVIALLCIYFGGWLLLNTLGLMNTTLQTSTLHYVPYGLVVLGALLLIAPFVNTKSQLGSNWLFGLISLSYGGALLTDAHHLISFGWLDIWKLWPVLIVYCGCMLLFGGRHQKKATKNHAYSNDHPDEAFDAKVFAQNLKHDIEQQIKKDMRHTEEGLRQKKDVLKQEAHQWQPNSKGQRQHEQERRQAQRENKLARFAEPNEQKTDDDSGHNKE